MSDPQNYTKIGGHKQPKPPSNGCSLPPGSGPGSKEQTPAGVDIFQHEHLKAPRNFRILRLHWKPGEYNRGLLMGSLLETSLDSHPEYYALSYTWGDPALVDEIVIDGRPFQITANCASALRRMLRGRFSRMVWVDSICINQSSTPKALDERGRQVSMMDEIYRHAVRVNVYLGEGGRATDVACRSLQGLSLAYLGTSLPNPLKKLFKAVYERRADDALKITPEFPHGKLHPEPSATVSA